MMCFFLYTYSYLSLTKDECVCGAFPKKINSIQFKCLLFKGGDGGDRGGGLWCKILFFFRICTYV